MWWLVRAGAGSAAYAAFDYALELAENSADPTAPAGSTWRRFSFKWENLASQEAVDDTYFTIDIANVTNGQVDGTWTSEDYTFVNGTFSLLLTGLTPMVASHNQLTEIRSYIMGFNPYSNSKPFIESGPPEVVIPQNSKGALAQPAGAQICTTVTEETPVRPHWGRFYSPSLGANALTSGGRIASPMVSALANAAHDCYQQLMGSQFFPVVPTTQDSKQPFRSLQTVSGVRVDDVPDVQRSRRPKHAITRVILPVVAGTQPAAPA